MPKWLVVLIAAVLAMAACSSEPEDVAGDEVASNDASDAASGEQAREAGEGNTPAADLEAPEPEPEPEPEPVDPAEVGANELGQIPVLMYHRVMEGAATEWDITPDEFRAELQYLYDNDYHPITTVELVRGEIDVPAGKTPVVLTFDDTVPEQFSYTEDGEIDPDTAVGILLDFHEQHPDWPVTGSFYVTDKRFDQPERGQEMFAHLHELGFEVGNHTIGHANLGEVDAEGVRRQLALGAAQIEEVLPEQPVATLSLPLGVWPNPRELAYEGTYDGHSYHHEGILLVGAEPSPSPFHAEFNPRAIPRIRSSPSWDGEADFMSGYWLDVLEQNPSRRYVSDGNPETVSFPADLADRLHPDLEDRANPYEATDDAGS